MKTILIPRVFHELFGEETTKIDLFTILLASLGGTGLVLWFDYTHLSALSLPVLIIILIFCADIFGGVVANMTKGTSLYYKERPSLRQIFIFIHIQPILFAILIQSYVLASVFIYLYVVLASTLVNALQHEPIHRGVAAAMFLFGALALILFGVGMPPYVLLFFLFYMMKLIVSFAVSHSHLRKIL